MQGLLSILLLFQNKFNKFNNTGARMLDSILSHDINDIKITVKEDTNYHRLMQSWVKVFRINPEFRILRPTFHRESATKY